MGGANYSKLCNVQSVGVICVLSEGGVLFIHCELLNSVIIPSALSRS